MEDFSSILFDTLDFIGYNQEVIRLRRNFWQQHGNALNLMTQNDYVYTITAGSKGEGITSCYQSDVDKMAVLTDRICIDTCNIAKFSRIPDMTVIHADTSEAPPGYTRLKLVTLNRDINNEAIKECAFESEANEICLSNSLYATFIKLMFTKSGYASYNAISGPAIQKADKLLPHDFVFAFPCYYPQLLQSWKSRPRRHEWPPVDVKEEAASMLAQVVPVGSKGSCDQWREWRFCFIESELKLTYSLNETQLKLYIILKIVGKDIFRQVSDEISSYIMKNVVYWLSELLPQAAFRKENLFSLLILSLRFLKSAISQWNWFPYYMIPGRNLLAERLTPVSRRQLTGLIETLIQEGPHFLLRCVKLRSALNLRIEAFALLFSFREKRDRVEFLKYCCALLRLHNVDISYINATNREVWDIVLPEWKTLQKRGIHTDSIDALMNQKIVELLS